MSTFNQTKYAPLGQGSPYKSFPQPSFGTTFSRPNTFTGSAHHFGNTVYVHCAYHNVSNLTQNAYGAVGITIHFTGDLGIMVDGKLEISAKVDDPMQPIEIYLVADHRPLMFRTPNASASLILVRRFEQALGKIVDETA